MNDLQNVDINLYHEYEDYSLETEFHVVSVDGILFDAWKVIFAASCVNNLGIDLQIEQSNSLRLSSRDHVHECKPIYFPPKRAFTVDDSRLMCPDIDHIQALLVSNKDVGVAVNVEIGERLETAEIVFTWNVCNSILSLLFLFVAIDEADVWRAAYCNYDLVSLILECSSNLFTFEVQFLPIELIFKARNPSSQFFHLDGYEVETLLGDEHVLIRVLRVLSFDDISDVFDAAFIHIFLIILLPLLFHFLSDIKLRNNHIPRWLENADNPIFAT